MTKPVETTHKVELSQSKVYVTSPTSDATRMQGDLALKVNQFLSADQQGLKGILRKCNATTLSIKVRVEAGQIKVKVLNPNFPHDITFSNTSPALSSQFQAIIQEAHVLNSTKVPDHEKHNLDQLATPGKVQPPKSRLDTRTFDGFSDLTSWLAKVPNVKQEKAPAPAAKPSAQATSHSNKQQAKPTSTSTSSSSSSSSSSKPSAPSQPSASNSPPSSQGSATRQLIDGFFSGIDPTLFSSDYTGPSPSPSPSSSSASSNSGQVARANAKRLASFEANRKEAEAAKYRAAQAAAAKSTPSSASAASSLSSMTADLAKALAGLADIRAKFGNRSDLTQVMTDVNSTLALFNNNTSSTSSSSSSSPAPAASSSSVLEDLFGTSTSSTAEPTNLDAWAENVGEEERLRKKEESEKAERSAVWADLNQRETALNELDSALDAELAAFNKTLEKPEASSKKRSKREKPDLHIQKPTDLTEGTYPEGYRPEQSTKRILPTKQECDAFFGTVFEETDIVYAETDPSKFPPAGVNFVCDHEADLLENVSRSLTHILSTPTDLSVPGPSPQTVELTLSPAEHSALSSLVLPHLLLASATSSQALVSSSPAVTSSSAMSLAVAFPAQQRADQQSVILTGDNFLAMFGPQLPAGLTSNATVIQAVRLNYSPAGLITSLEIATAPRQPQGLITAAPSASTSRSSVSVEEAPLVASPTIVTVNVTSKPTAPARETLNRTHVTGLGILGAQAAPQDTYLSRLGRFFGRALGLSTDAAPAAPAVVSPRFEVVGEDIELNDLSALRLDPTLLDD